MARIEPNWKDEILTGEPKYLIRDANNQIVVENASIDMTTPVIQEATDLNKANLETPIGEIRSFSSERDDEKYLLCDGSSVNIADYPQLYSNMQSVTKIYTTFNKIFAPLETSIYNGTIKFFPSINLYVCSCYGYKYCSILTSSDGINWVERYLYTFSDSFAYKLSKIKYISELNAYIAYADTNDGIIVFSKDCINWEKIGGTNGFDLSEPNYSPKLNKIIYTMRTPSVTRIHTIDSDGTDTLIQSISSAVYPSTIIEHNNTLYATVWAPNRAGTNNLYSSNDGISWNTTGFNIKNFNPTQAVKIGNTWYSYWDEYIGKIENGVATTIYTGTEYFVALVKVNNYAVAISASGGIYKIDSTGVTLVNSIDMANVTNAYYLENKNEIFLFNGEIKRIDAATFQLKNINDVLHGEYDRQMLGVTKDYIYISLMVQSGNYSWDTDVFDDNKFSLPILEGTGIYSYIKALGGE